MRTIKNVIKKNKYIDYFFLWLLRYFPNSIIFNIQRVQRIIGIPSGDFKKIIDFKDKHKDERCFIVATGPSLRINDLDKLKNEITFSMNSIVLSFNETSWRPTYYGIQDLRAYEALKEEIDSAKMQNVFCGVSLNKNTPNLSSKVIAYPLNLLNHNGGFLKHYTKFSSNAYSVVYDGFTITYSLIQIAVYMGFKEIYLLGVDCSYPKNGMNHFKDYITQTNENAGYLMEQSYKIAKEFADKNNIKIYNASRGGSLEVFERVNFDELKLS